VVGAGGRLASQADVLRVGLLVGGALASHSVVQVGPGWYRLVLLCGEWERRGWVGVVVGTLLGPEGTGMRVSSCLVVSSQGAP
jgi:hypothetical protein